jgi:hypothetical protein
MKLAVVTFAIAAVFAASSEAQPPKKFMGGPVTIEDQGSFFVGGVTKERARGGPFAPPADAPRPRRRSPSARCTSSSKFARKAGPGFGRDHGTAHAHRRRAGARRRRPRWCGIRTSGAKASRLTSSTNRRGVLISGAARGRGAAGMTPLAPPSSSRTRTHHRHGA